MDRNIKLLKGSIIRTFAIFCTAVFCTLTVSSLHADPPFGTGPFPEGPFISINCDAPGTDLQNTINGAASGASITVKGTCDGGPFLIQGKVLIFVGPATLSAASGDSTLIISGATVTIHGITVDGAGMIFGINTIGSVIDLNGVEVKNAEIGIRVGGNSRASIRGGSDIHHNTGDGVHVTDSSNAFIDSSKFRNNSYAGISITHSSSGIITNNMITLNQNGLLVTKMSSGLILQNTIDWNLSKGVWIASQYGFIETLSPVNTIENNPVDVQCEDRGIFESSLPQISSTNNTVISPNCAVIGTIF